MFGMDKLLLPTTTLCHQCTQFLLNTLDSWIFAFILPEQLRSSLCGCQQIRSNKKFLVKWFCQKSKCSDILLSATVKYNFVTGKFLTKKWIFTVTIYDGPNHTCDHFILYLTFVYSIWTYLNKNILRSSKWKPKKEIT